MLCGVVLGVWGTVVGVVVVWRRGLWGGWGGYWGWCDDNYYDER